MKISILLFAFLIPVFSFATTKSFQIATQLFVDGKLVSAPRMTTLPGEAGEISQHSEGSSDYLTIKVVASDMSNDKVKDGILMKFDILYKKGKRTVKSSPEILAKPGSDSSVTIGKKDEGEIQLKVTAIRQ